MINCNICNHVGTAICIKCIETGHSEFEISYKPHDLINHPAHYTFGSIEVLDVIEDWQLSYVEGNIIKYIARYKYKNGIEDLEKAKFYIERLICTLKSQKKIS